MRMTLNALIPHEPFNSLVRAETAGTIVLGIFAQLKPEAAYFVEEHAKADPGTLGQMWT